MLGHEFAHSTQCVPFLALSVLWRRVGETLTWGSTFAWRLHRPIKRPRTIQFGVLSPEEIKAISVCKVEYPETFEEGNAKPVSRVSHLSLRRFLALLGPS